MSSFSFYIIHKCLSFNSLDFMCDLVVDSE